jgi:hypothetical protein
MSHMFYKVFFINMKFDGITHTVGNVIDINEGSRKIKGNNSNSEKSNSSD